MKDRKIKEKPSKRYFSTFDLDELVLKYPSPKRNMSSKEIETEKRARRYLLDFLKKVLQIDPIQRLTPEQAMRHPFINESSHYAQARYDEIISLGKGIMKKSKLHSPNTNLCSESESESEEEESEEEEVPEMLTGVRRKSYANTEARSSLSVSPYSRKRVGSASSNKAIISPISESNEDALLLDDDAIDGKSSSFLQPPDSTLRYRHNKEHHR
jgi:serine/threonine protein kinase